MAASDARALAIRLATLDDDALLLLLDRRRAPSTATWADFYDLADALLDPASLSRALTGLNRAQASALDDAVTTGDAVAQGPAADDLLAAALVDESGMPYVAVRELWPPAPVAVEPLAPGVPESDERTAERAFTASASLADVLQLTIAAPLARIGSGALGATARRRLVDAGAAADDGAADDLVAIAEHAGLLAAEDREWLVTPRGVEWLSTATVSRWHTVAERLRDALPAALRSADGGWEDAEQWASAYPFDPAWPARATRLRRLFVQWGMLRPDGAVAAWARGLADGADADVAALQALLPPEVDRVYLQNDLTAIAPGPLAPHLDLRLRSMARRESRAQASTYRFTAESLDAALTGGETAESIREFLTGLSLTGVPQPLAYELERSASRHGRIRIGTDAAGRTRITSDDPALLHPIAVDQALRPLGLVTDGDDLVTRNSVDTAFWMLADARYPIVAVDADGIPRHIDRHRLADEPAGVGDPTVRFAPLVARLRAAHADDADAAWLGREIEQAVRAHAIVAVVVRLPDGSQREFTMEATGLGGGRLRGRDRAADVERTLPISSIASVRLV